jgi:hypothetical protein
MPGGSLGGIELSVNCRAENTEMAEQMSEAEAGIFVAIDD